METNTNTTTTTRQTHKRTFSESDSTSRTERYLCSFTHLWIINYLSSYIDDPNSTYLQSETFSPVNTPYSNTRWTLKLYPRGLNEKQTPTNNNNNNNNNIAIFLKYVCGTIPTIKAKAEFSVVSRNNELVLLRSTNFHTFSSGNDWGYSEFLDGNYLNSRRNDLLTDDRLRVYVRVILVDEKEPSSHELFSSQTIHSSKSQQASSSSISTINSHLKTPSLSRLLSTDKDRLKSFELLSKQIHSLFDDQRFTDMNIHIIPKQDEQKKSHRQRRTSIKQQNLCQCTNHSNEQISDQHEQIFKDFDLSTSRRTTRSLTSRLARTSSSSSSDLCSTSIPKFCSCQSSLEQEHLNDLVDYSQIIPLATFHVHKSILIARSSLFAHQIRLKLSQSKSLSSSLNLYIDDLQPLTVRTMLIYIYTGQLPNITDEIYQHLNLIDLFRASVKYNLHELRHLTKTTMLDNLKIDNAIEMLEISDQANDQDFKQHILSFIRSNALAITKTTHWIDCTKQNPQLIIDAFRSLVTPTLTKYSNHYHHSISLTTTKQSKND